MAFMERASANSQCEFKLRSPTARQLSLAVVRRAGWHDTSGVLVAAHRRLLMPICRAGSPLLVVAIHTFGAQSSDNFLIRIDFLTCFRLRNEGSCARQVDLRSAEDESQGPEEDCQVER